MNHLTLGSNSCHCQVAAKQAEEARRREEERLKYAEMIASGKSEWVVKSLGKEVGMG